MKNLVKNSFYASAWTLLLGLNSVNAAGDAGGAFGQQKVTIQWEQTPLADAIQGYINFFMTFLTLIAIIYALWGGFNILTAGGDEEKVKKWKTILIQGWVWLLVIWLAWTIVGWVISLLAS